MILNNDADADDIMILNLDFSIVHRPANYCDLQTNKQINKQTNTHQNYRP